MSDTLSESLRERATCIFELEQIASTLHKRIEKHQASGRTLTLKVKFADYQQITRSKTLLMPIKELGEIIGGAMRKPPLRERAI
ncbi:hypothetical protein [Calothrix sp. CCY 0018]|uniref:DinB/UmuC family translesion DNA polymerase n=1 Tax=Calothrix sp. CCY 0018 TaxID=3103864 RepID=UPI0039C6A417